ncbi:YetF domain-containing protein [Paenibacillus motobuensis]|uniref:YetF domain-containing protein n=1 Tax=Paenibacillus motobuensis TaxID=295324 RepID=UPI003CD0688F
MNGYLQFNFWEMILRTTITFLVLLTLARLLGEKQIGHLTFFDYVTGITIGSIAAEIVVRRDTPFFNGIISLIWWAILAILISYLSLKSSKARIMMDGQPKIIIKQGKIMRETLKSTRLNLDDLCMMLREKDVFSIQDVHYAILEPDGKISVLRKEFKQPVTKGDLNIPTPNFTYLPAEIISDGKIIKKNLKELNLDENWLQQELNKKGIHSAEEVFYAEVQSDGSLFFDRY